MRAADDRLRELDGGRHRLLGVRSRGRPLEHEVRLAMEARLGHSFANVRVHDDEAAAASADALGARAYTVSRDVVFAPREYAPRTAAGAALLAHELAHVVQQSAAPGAPSGTHAAAEADARATAAAVAAGRSFAPALRTAVRRAAQDAPRAGAGTVALPEPPATDPVWIPPPRLRPGSVPVYDEETGVVVAYRYYSSGYWEIYDLEGRIIETGETPLESPLIDPIDILAGGITGVFRGLFGGVTRGAARGIAAGAGGAAARAGARTALSILGRRALDAARAAWRAIRFRGALNFTQTAAAHMAEAGRYVPVHILRLAIRWGTRTADPRGVPGAFRYVIRMFKGSRSPAGNWVYKEYTLEVVLREADQTILHFLYRP